MVMPQKTLADYRHAGQKAAAKVRKEQKPNVPTERQKALVDAMVFEGMTRKAAAEAIGLSDESARAALIKPHVLAYLNEQTEVLRTGLRPRALHTMGELLDSKNDSTKFKAAEYLDGQNRGTHTVGAAMQVNVQVNNTVKVTPGYVIKIDRRDDVKSAPQIDHLEQDEVIGLETLEGVPEED